MDFIQTSLFFGLRKWLVGVTTFMIISRALRAIWTHSLTPNFLSEITTNSPSIVEMTLYYEKAKGSFEMSTYHIIGKRVRVKKGHTEIVRYHNKISDEQFNRLVYLIGGQLPKGFMAWHISDDPTEQLRYKRLIHQNAVVLDKQNGGPADGIKEMLEARDMDPKYYLFVHGETNKHIILSHKEIRNGVMESLQEDGYRLRWLSAPSQKEAELKSRQDYKSELLRYDVVPITLKQAKGFINTHHRHHKEPQGHKFSIGITDGLKLIGVAIAGRPVSRHKDDGRTLEVTRCCVKPGYKNACSQLYARIKRIAKEMGFRQVITYTLEEENGASLRASGFDCSGISGGGSWSGTTRIRVDKHPTGKKLRWELSI